MRGARLVTKYARLWDRKVYDFRDGKNRMLESVKKALEGPGVYVLYRDDEPYYIGKTTGKLFGRIHAHANRTTDTYFQLWNYFSAFFVPNRKNISEVERILIAAMPTTANSAKPRIKWVPLPREVVKRLQLERRITSESPPRESDRGRKSRRKRKE